MLGTRIGVPGILGLFSALAMALMPGCAAVRRAYSRPAPALTAQPPSPAQAARPQDGERDVLAAVEEFLDRTRSYQAAPAQVTPESSLPPAIDVTAPQFGGGASLTAWVAGAPDAPVSGVHANGRMMLASSQDVPARPALPVIESITVSAATVSKTSVVDRVETNAANHSLELEAPPIAVSADLLISDLEKQAVAANDFDSAWTLRLARFALNREANDADGSSSLSPKSAQLLSTFLRVARAVRGAAREPLLAGGDALEQVDELRGLLVASADPVVVVVALCRKVVTFGVYDEIGEADLVAGRVGRAIVYSEIRNFASERTEEGRYRTRIATRIEAFTVDGESVWQHEEPEIVDLCRRRRNDFFIAQRVTLPPTLPAGDYVLKVRVEDLLAGRADEGSCRFTVQSALSLANGR